MKTIRQNNNAITSHGADAYAVYQAGQGGYHGLF